MIVNNTSVWADNPQAAEIDALIERSGRLTDGEIDALSKEWCPSDDDALYAAEGASWYAIRYASWYTTRYTARYTVAARDAASDTACALVVRDLIDERTAWNQAAYNLLTAPWAKVFGPVHPDDVVNNTSVWADNPQAAEIDALIERYRNFSAEDLVALGRFRGYLPISATITVRNILADSGRSSAMTDLAHMTAGLTGNTGKLVRQTFAALLVRDLVDENTLWNWKTYDSITIPLRSALGAIHSGDKEIKNEH